MCYNLGAKNNESWQLQSEEKVKLNSKLAYVTTLKDGRSERARIQNLAQRHSATISKRLQKAG